ncbi:HutD/Ves family protein [Pannonibacter carbonis]|uniref:HutD/Ves family protein n=1 Tax=Pannonibacter carbonis TaxID=2067569 RepID=UPI0018E5205F|nr:HutD family protein [Pannonibacter carbonis]
MNVEEKPSIRVIRWGEAKAMPWKNGGGVTHEIAVFPVGATFETFDWRLSMAEVAADGPFSAFAGIDRTLALMDGAGIDLDFGDGRRERVDGPGALCRFDGGAACSGYLVDGPILDLNVMIRRGRLAHDLVPVSVTVAGQDLSDVTAVICHTGSIAIKTAAGEVVLDARDVLICGSVSRIWCRNAAEAGAMAYVLRIRNVT